MRAVSKMWSVLRACWAYLGEVLGERDYDRYVTYLRQHHPHVEVPTEREYWRARWANQERSPQGRCC